MYDAGRTGKRMNKTCCFFSPVFKPESKVSGSKSQEQKKSKRCQHWYYYNMMYFDTGRKV
jgi:hypothetical protein